ncbi:hypothetical protein [Chachezhania antarctica]|uniref:hypothetical protein n=1 Tax=Chachezhania antarctica TaxID=2340860 RepID=UPI000EAC4397|nr:hypothetical protein [Chachezhania antarctica]|tara:strand:+ start:987 stop:2165 length:1179 start_codon:yes stop_codon:yes gene_type:complete
MTGLSKLLSAALLAATASPAFAQSAPFENLSLYGHFSPAIVSFGDGEATYTGLADNSYSGGRVGLWYTLPGDRVQTRFNAETSLGLRQSASLSQDNVPPAINLNAATVRKLEMIIETDRAGSFSLGLGSMASDGVAESDLSSTQLAAYVGISDTAGGYDFRTGDGAISTVSVYDAFPTFDGGRAPRARWDSPDLSLHQYGTFNVAAALGIKLTDGVVVVNDSLADIGLFYRNSLGDFEVKTSFGTSLARSETDTAPQAAGSASLLHAPSGWSLTAATGTREGQGQYIYSKLGLTRRWSAWGDTAVSVDAYRGGNTVASGTRASSYGIGVVQDLDHLDLQFYLGLRRYEYSAGDAVTYRTSDSILFGTKWVFGKLTAPVLSTRKTDADWSESD